MIILGIDPGYAIVGYGVIDKDNKGRAKVIDYGTIETPKDEEFPTRLVMIADGIKALIKKFQPEQMAIEELFFNQNITTGIAVAEARGVIICTAMQEGIKIYEYTPLEIKLSITGNGRAEKKQVQYMTVAILGLKSTPKPDDAADALAVALCHSQTNLELYNGSHNQFKDGTWANTNLNKNMRK